MTPTVSLGAQECLDPSVVGDKAARLARAKAAGLTVPDSVVVPCAVSAAVLAAATRDVHRRGLHACWLDVMAADHSALADLVMLARDVGPTLAVRSSAQLEDDPRLAGAYSSLIGVRPEEVPTAVLAVWASAIRGPGQPPQMAVLIQPELTPDWAGTAELGGDGSVCVTATRGGAQALTAGWAGGVTVRVSPSGDLTPAGPETVNGPVLRAAAALARDVATALGDTMVEWAFAEGRAWLIQSRRAPAVPAPELALASSAPGYPEPLVARDYLVLAARCAGDLAERWILPWAIAGDGSHAPHQPLTAGHSRDEHDPSDEHGPGGEHGPGELLARAAAVWTRLTTVSDQLTCQVWGVGRAQAGQISARLAALRHGGDTGLADRLPSLRPPDPVLARRCLDLAAELAAHLRAAGVIASARHFWALPAELGPVLRGRVRPQDPQHSAYKAALSWEPLLYSVAAAGARLPAVPVAPGIGCGPAVLADDVAELAMGQAGWLPPRPVIVARYPLPRYSPLLMGAAGLVAYGGSEAAHLVTVARSLGVPAVLGCDLRPVVEPGCYVAVDGTEGTVSVLSPRFGDGSGVS